MTGTVIRPRNRMSNKRLAWGDLHTFVGGSPAGGRDMPVKGWGPERPKLTQETDENRRLGRARGGKP